MAVSEGVCIKGIIGREYILYDLNKVIIGGIVVKEQGIREKVVVDLNWLPQILLMLVGHCIYFSPYVPVIDEILE